MELLYFSLCTAGVLAWWEGNAHRKDWMESRLEFLSQVFAVSVGAFSAMDNHLHVLLRLDREQAEVLSPQEIARRWGVLCPPRDGNRQPMAITAGWIKRIAQDTVWVETTRERLCDLSWFMKFPKEPIARQANAEDKVTGAFWEGRFKSVAILDETSLLATMAYIDLNPVAANLAATPESSPHTSIKARIDHCVSQRQLELVRTGNRYSLKQNVETGLWLLPIQDRRNDSAIPPSATHHSAAERDCPTSVPSAMVTNKAQQQSTEPAEKAVQVSPRQRSLAGMLQGISLRGYLELLDWSSRLVRPGKASISTAAPPILERLRISEANWMDSDTAETLRPRKDLRQPLRFNVEPERSRDSQRPGVPQKHHRPRRRTETKPLGIIAKKVQACTKLSHPPTVRGHRGLFARFGHSLPCSRYVKTRLPLASLYLPSPRNGYGSRLKTLWDSTDI